MFTIEVYTDVEFADELFNLQEFKHYSGDENYDQLLPQLNWCKIAAHQFKRAKYIKLMIGTTVCIICNKVNHHTASTCPEKEVIKPKCFNCHQPGHTFTACPNNITNSDIPKLPCIYCKSIEHRSPNCKVLRRKWSPLIRRTP